MADRPNILMVWTDQQRRDTFAAGGNAYVRAPHLNRLVSESVVFRHACCVQPVCTPSRGSILTGLWPHAHGAVANNVPLHPDAQTIAEMLDDDYYKAYFGKWHLGREYEAQHGFDEWVSIEDNYRDSSPDAEPQYSDYHRFLESNGFVPNRRDRHGNGLFSREFAAVMAPRFTKAHFLGRRAADFLEGQDGSRPFFLSVNFLEPHSPFFGPYNDWYEPAEVPTGPAFAVAPTADASAYVRAKHAMFERYGACGMQLQDSSSFRRLRANYLGLVSLVDDAVGMILAALEASGQADNTLVVFTSDHGEMMGDHGLMTKGVMYEQSIGVPWMIRAPWLKREHRMIDGRVSQIDLAPTVLELAGATVPGHLQGRSRAGVVEGVEDLTENDVFAMWNSRNVAELPAELQGFSQAERDAFREATWRTIIHDDRWKLNHSAIDRSELYDLQDDPYEMHNLIDDASHRGRVTDLRERIARWQREIADPAEPAA